MSRTLIKFSCLYIIETYLKINIMVTELLLLKLSGKRGNFANMEVVKIYFILLNIYLLKYIQNFKKNIFKQ